MIQTSEARVYPEKGKYDVVVCGGGPSGFVAAVAAARRGARTALVERLSFLGGMATAGYVAPISEFNKNGRRIIGGIAWEAMLRLARQGGADVSYPIGNVPYDPELYKLTIQEMLTEAGVDIYTDSMLVDCVQDDHKRVTQVLCASSWGHFALRGRYFLDCTGDGALCALADAPFLPMASKEECQPATLCFRLANVDTDHLENIHLREANTRYFNSRIKELLLSLGTTESVPNFGGPWFCWGMHNGVVSVNMTRAEAVFHDPLKASQTACRLRLDAIQFTRLLRKYVQEFKDCYMMDSGVLIGYRESRRIRGAYVLTGEDLRRGFPFFDTIAASAHPVDIHVAKDTSQKVTFLDQEGFIPYRSLFIPGFPNLLVAGRLISADRDAFASIRVQAPCMATGAAAGTGAALAAKTGISVAKVCIAELRDALSLPETP